MIRKLSAWLYLALAFWRHILLLRPWRRRFGLATFRLNYAPDHLRPLTPDERRAQPRHARCIDCGLCVAAFEEAARPAAAPSAPFLPTLPLRLARAGHDAWAFDEHTLETILGSSALAAAEAVCPTRVPLAEVGRFVLRAHGLSRPRPPAAGDRA